ncbi:MAG: oxidoreductase [Proteobacteria bacterium]|nr:oxidoreductase [Pseudomonadota bacterium]MBU1687422.1 oxidoreductase [Pseudomonadota bacterium]
MNLLFWSWGILLVGGLAALFPGLPRQFARWLGCCSAVAGCIFGLGATIDSLGHGPATYMYPWTVPGGAVSLSIDGLAAFFLVPIFLIGLLGAIYGFGYLADSSSRTPGKIWFFYNLLILSMTLVVTAANGMLFLVAWEVMSLSSFFLVIDDHKQSEVRRAGLLYLLATHLGGACLFAFFLGAGTLCGSLEFSVFSRLATLPPIAASTLFCLMLLGFGSKAGLFPLHVWLPEAHPAAPSHVSALMSGAMVKVGIYGMLRMLSFFSVTPAWWGWLMIVAGLGGALFGIGMAATQSDLKRSLGYSTVENIGIIFFALGFWLIARAEGHTLAASLALTGGLLHIWNHALFKSLLFFGAGSILHGSGSRNLNRMGGLLGRMPVTGLTLVAGAMAVGALPPMNGLVGEWFIYRALIESGGEAQGMAGFYPLVLMGLLALVGGMVILVFTRLIGIALLGQPHHHSATTAHESGWPMLAPMMVLTGLCLVAGVLPTLLMGPVAAAGAILGHPLLLPRKEWISAMWLGLGGGGIILMIGMVVIVTKIFSRKGSVGSASTWGCGFQVPTFRMSYSAEGYVELAQKGLFCSCLRPQISGGRAISLFPGPAELFHRSTDLVLTRLYHPVFARSADLCSRLRRVQAGIVHLYLFYIFLATILLLGWVAHFQG